MLAPSPAVLGLLLLAAWIGRQCWHERPQLGAILGAAVGGLLALLLAAVTDLALLTPWQAGGHGGSLLLVVPLAWWWWRCRLQPAVSSADAADLALVAIVGGLLGGRGLAIAVYGSGGPASGAWWDPDAGMILYGAVIGAVVAAAALIWRRGLPAGLLADAVVPPAFLLLAAGRLGCQLNGCCWGASCEQAAWWTVDSPAGPAVPAQLLEAGAAALGCIISAAWSRSRRGSGQLAWLALAGYAAWRLLAETWRGDPRPGWLGLSHSQWISLAVLAVGLGAQFWRWRRQPPPTEMPTAP